MLSRHGGIPWHGPAISAVAIAIRTMALEVQLLGHPAHGLQRLCLLLFGQFLHGQKSETKCNLKICLTWLNPNANTICKTKSFLY